MNAVLDDSLPPPLLPDRAAIESAAEFLRALVPPTPLAVTP